MPCRNASANSEDISEAAVFVEMVFRGGIFGNLMKRAILREMV